LSLSTPASWSPAHTASCPVWTGPPADIAALHAAARGQFGRAHAVIFRSRCRCACADPPARGVPLGRCRPPPARWLRLRGPNHKPPWRRHAVDPPIEMRREPSYRRPEGA
jgi:hypothetical protein